MEEWMKLIPKLYKSLLKTVGHAWPRSPDLLYDHFESGRLHFNFVMHHVQATSEPGTAHVLPSRMTSNQLWDVLQSYVHGQAWDTLDHLICIYMLDGIAQEPPEPRPEPPEAVPVDSLPATGPGQGKGGWARDGPLVPQT